MTSTEPAVGRGGIRPRHVLRAVFGAALLFFISGLTYYAGPIVIGVLLGLAGGVYLLVASREDEWDPRKWTGRND